MRLNKFVRRLHDMLQTEQNSGIVEWRRGLLVLHSTDAFAKTILPKYFNTRNFKTFRRQLNYYGFVHVRSFSTTGSSTTALWVNRELAQNGTAKISTVLTLKRVEPCESAKTAEGRRVRKELAVSTVEEDIGVSAKTLQLEQMQTLALRDLESGFPPSLVPSVVHCDPKQNLSSLALLPLTSSITWGETIDNAVSDNSDNDDDAAYLLMMLSKSNARSPPLANMV
jgi:HSF-type DNA-binding